MASLSPQRSRSNSQVNIDNSGYQSSDDGYDYNMVDDGPEVEATKPRDHAAELRETPKDTNAARGPGDPDHAFVETMPNIWQRSAGGWRAKPPDDDLEKGVMNGVTQNVKGLPQTAPEVISIRLRWTMPKIDDDRRRLELNADESEVDIQETALQRRRVRWRHSQHWSMQLGTLQKTVNQTQNQGHPDKEHGLTRRLLKRVRNVAEKDFDGGRFLTPLALRYDNQDVSRYTVDKTCVFFSFPYFHVEKPVVRETFKRNDDQHPPRTLVQSHYRLHKTTERDEHQCISLLKGRNMAYSTSSTDREKRNRRRKIVQDLVHVPQLWGVIVGLDTLVTNGPICDAALRGSTMRISEHPPRPLEYQLSLVRILFTYQGRREDLIWPVIQCDSWFGLLNKQQQILEFLGTEKEKVRPNDYRFWFDGRQPITISNWSTLLRKHRSTEIVDIWMKKDVPKIQIQPAEDDGIQIRQPDSDPAENDIPNDPNDVPVISAFLAWDILDEFGEADPLPLSDRISRFLKAIYNRVTAEVNIQVLGKSRYQVREYLETKQNDSHVSELGKNLQLLFEFYVPEGEQSATHPIEIYWGAAYEIINSFAKTDSKRLNLPEYSKLVAEIVYHARRLHQGVYRVRAVQDPITKQWQYKEAVAEGAVLLAVVIDALGEILQMIIETVQWLRGRSIALKESGLVEHGKEACKLLKAAKDQLIREADGRDKNGNIGPVVTPEAITISLLERLTSGVLNDGTVDIIQLYEECLEHLALKVEHEASRRLLKSINIFQEEIAIIKDVLDQQISVLAGLRKTLDPATFRTPSITRKLRYKFECKAIDEIAIKIREQAKKRDELLERAKLLAVQNVQLVETFQDDNSKAIFVFTIVTVLFLPMGFVASFFGMNVIGISNTVTTLRHFWTIALSLTFGIVIPCTIAALKGEDVYFLVARMHRGVRQLWSGAS